MRDRLDLQDRAPQNLQTHKDMSVIHERLGALYEAWADPSDPSNEKGLLHKALTEYLEARACLDRVIAIADSDVVRGLDVCDVNAADVRLKLGDPLAALNLFGRAIKNLEARMEGHEWGALDRTDFRYRVRRKIVA